MGIEHKFLEENFTKGFHTENAILKNKHFKPKVLFLGTFNPNTDNKSNLKLQELIYEDLKNYPNSSISDIHARIGDEIKRRTIRTMMDKMITDDIIKKHGKKKGTKYFIDAKP